MGNSFHFYFIKVDVFISTCSILIYICQIKTFKTYLTFCLIGLFLSTIIGPAYTVAYFYINQTEIADELCENKDKPAMNCNGHCYLKKELTKQKEISTEQENSEISLLVIWPSAFSPIDEVKLFDSSQKKTYNTHYSNHYRLDNEMDLLDPPQV